MNPEGEVLVRDQEVAPVARRPRAVRISLRCREARDSYRSGRVGDVQHVDHAVVDRACVTDVAGAMEVMDSVRGAIRSQLDGIGWIRERENAHAARTGKLIGFAREQQCSRAVNVHVLRLPKGCGVRVHEEGMVGVGHVHDLDPGSAASCEVRDDVQVRAVLPYVARACRRTRNEGYFRRSGRHGETDNRRAGPRAQRRVFPAIGMHVPPHAGVLGIYVHA